jgi:hypothetical protein
MATQTLVSLERRSWGAMLGTFGLMGAIGYLTEQSVRMQTFRGFSGKFDGFRVEHVCLTRRSTCRDRLYTLTGASG